MSNHPSPFSARNRRADRQVDQDFPDSARKGLLHLLHDLVERRYVRGWPKLARELQRIYRTPVVVYDEYAVPDINRAQKVVEELVEKGAWDKIVDFLERLYSHLAQKVEYYEEVETPRSEVQQYVAQEITRLLTEENLALKFRDGCVWRRGHRHTRDQVARAGVVLMDSRLNAAREHYEKALKYFRDPSSPDPENTVKEAVCAVEAALKALFPVAKGNTLGDKVKAITGLDEGNLPPAIAKTFHGLYGFRSSGTGVGHGGSSGGPATWAIAEYVLAVAASQIILLDALAVPVESKRKSERSSLL